MLSISWELEDKQLVINWVDSSPGVSDDEKGELCERLFRADNSRNRRTGGSGLGLAIVKNIIEAHGGPIEVADSSLGGLIFILRLPVQ